VRRLHCGSRHRQPRWRPGLSRQPRAARGPADPLRSWLAGHALCITFVTLGELIKWTVLRDCGPRRLASFESWRHQVVLLPFDGTVAVKWDELQAKAQLRGRPRPVNDSWIAACCVAHGLPLATFNTRDFVALACAAAKARLLCDVSLFLRFVTRGVAGRSTFCASRRSEPSFGSAAEGGPRSTG
jgi:hypothetical protein